MERRIFTLDEANQMIPDLVTRLAALNRKKETYARRHDDLFMHELLKQAEGPHSEKTADDLESEIQNMEEAITSLEKELDEIKALGCVLRNIDRGYVDFLGQKDGELVYFCWKMGEDSIQFYHPLQHGSRDRIPLRA